MSPMQGKPHRYSHLTSEEEEAQSFISLEEKDAQLDLARRGSKSPLRKALPWLLHLLLLTAYLVGVFCWKRPLLIKESFDSPSDVPIEYETVQFFAGVGNDISEYQGPSTPQTDAAWSNLLDVGPGLMWIDEESAMKLPTETAKRRNGTGYAVALEMFHQLHCLNRIRTLFYHPKRNIFDETPEIFKEHTEHCFDYLRQTLMCHGDVGLMSMNWDLDMEGYTAKFGVQKTCRNFDKIKAWTKEHQTGWWPTHLAKDER